ncbi:MAG TPA: tetratricopeptide repeat protein, partial [Vicinamibacterales bacterium]|nr:tetratricopeptide repeat protein [Vicinamibacterales bacterium]
AEIIAGVLTSVSDRGGRPCALKPTTVRRCLILQRRPSMSNRRRSFAVLILIAVIVVPLTGQAPPPELRFDVITDVGQVPAPPVCGCITQPFKVMRIRPGWGYGSGPAAPDTDAPPSRDGQRNDVEAAKWFLLAANQGHQKAYVQLGHRYHRGQGLEQSDELAAYWFYQGATHGDTLGMIALGSLYAAGRGVPQNWKIAVSWWRKANHHRFIGDAYACGLGVARNNERAVREYQKGAENGDMSSAIQLGHMHAGRCAAPADDELAYTWYDRAAHQGYPEAQLALASLVLQDRAEGGPMSAYMWARLAELRLPSGELRMLAAKRASEAARRLSQPQIANTEVLVKNMIETGSEAVK